MFSASHRHLAVLALALAAPVLAVASSIDVNGTCDFGTCPPTDTIGPGGSVPFTNFSFDVTVNGDLYQISGDYSASNTTNSPSGYTGFGGDVTAEYIGSTPTLQSDSLTIDFFQDFSVPADYSLSGTYDESAFIGIGGAAPGSSYEFQTLYNAQTVGLLGPYTTSGTHSASKDLTITGQTLDEDAQFTFDFAAGTTKGAYMTTTPEPAGLLPLMAILLVFIAVPAVRRRRSRANNSV